ncbi:MAG TPA: putative Ig domain-containing protein, partial [Pirellulales bacterium]
GDYSITVTADNGVGTPASQAFTLTVTSAPVNIAPTITSPDNISFESGSSGTFTITTTGNPNAAITFSGSLPAGVTLTDNGDGTATLAGTPGVGTEGDYSITITADNGVGTPASQPFTLTVTSAPVNVAPTITSPDNISFEAGSSGTFTITTTGAPNAAITFSGSLPAGVTLTDNNDGTATLAGTPAAGIQGAFQFTITADNGVGAAATQTFTLTVNSAPAITTADHATFVAGSPGSFTIVTTGFPNAVITASGSLPAGITLADNGNGTATLSGTSPAWDSGVHQFTITANNGVGAAATQTFTLTVNSAPAVTSADHVTFVAGSAGTFTIATTGFPHAAITVSGSLPAGITLTDHGDGTATLAGTAALAAKGVYQFTLTANNGVGTNATQVFKLTVGVAPAFTSLNHATLDAGAPGAFVITTTGFPNAAITVSGSLPSGVTLTDNGDGTAKLSGTPASGSEGTYQLVLTASNGAGIAATQVFKLTVGSATPVEATITGVGVDVSGFEYTALNAVVVATFTYDGGAKPADQFAATIDWGDGTTSPGTIALSGSTYTITGSHTYGDEGVFLVKVAVSGGGASATIAAQARILEELLPDGSRGTPEERFISEVYRDLLNRPVDAAGLAYWSDYLAAHDRNSLVAAVRNTTEFHHVLIEQLYQRYLHRGADAPGLNHWADLMASGWSAGQVATQIVASAEYHQVRGQGSDDRFVDVLFADALGRTVDADAKSHFSGRLAQGASREQVVTAVFASDEAVEAIINAYYRQFLDRDADAQGLSAFAAAMRSGWTDEQIIASIVGSNEYFAKTAT